MSGHHDRRRWWLAHRLTLRKTSGAVPQVLSRRRPVFAHPIGGLKATPFGVENKREKELTRAHLAQVAAVRRTDGVQGREDQAPAVARLLAR